MSLKAIFKPLSEYQIKALQDLFLSNPIIDQLAIDSETLELMIDYRACDGIDYKAFIHKEERVPKEHLFPWSWSWETKPGLQGFIKRNDGLDQWRVKQHITEKGRRRR